MVPYFAHTGGSVVSLKEMDVSDDVEGDDDIVAEGVDAEDGEQDESACGDSDEE